MLIISKKIGHLMPGVYIVWILGKEEICLKLQMKSKAILTFIYRKKINLKTGITVALVVLFLVVCLIIMETAKKKRQLNPI